MTQSRPATATELNDQNRAQATGEPHDHPGQVPGRVEFHVHSGGVIHRNASFDDRRPALWEETL